MSSSIHVLFIEDEITLQHYTRTALTERGFTVSAATNTSEADRILKDNKIDVIVCDILMPLENGLSYLKRLRDTGHFVPVILLSALGEQAVVKLGIDAGAADYMMKPFQIDDLYRRIQTLVGRSRPKPERN